MASEQVQIVINATDNASATLKTIQGNLTRFQEGFASALKNAVPASQAFAAGLAGITAAGAGIATMMVKSASEIEQTSIAFTTLLGSAKKAQDFVAQMKEFAKKTPLETADIAKGAQVMLSFGISAEQVLPNLKMIGDVSLGNKEKFQALSLAFSQVQATGRLMGQDLLQMINQGFNPLQIISEKTGKSMAQLKGEMEKGAISAEMVSDAFKTATSEGGRFFGGMESQSKSLQGTFSTLQDIFSQFLGEMAESTGLMNVLKSAVGQLTNFLEKNGDTIKNSILDGFNKIKDNIPLIAGIIVGGLTPAFIALASAVIAATAPLLPFIAAGAAIGVLLPIIIEKLGGWSNIMATMQPIIDTVTNAVIGVWNAFVGFIPTLQMVWNLMAEALAPLLPVLSNLFISVWNAIQQLWSAFMNLWNLLAPVLIPVLQVLGGILVGTLYVAFLTVIEVVKIAIEVITGIINAITWAISKYNEFIVMLTNFRNQVFTFWQGIMAKTTEARQSIGNVIKELWEFIKLIWTTEMNFIKGFTDTVLGVIKGVFDFWIKIFTGNWSGAWNSMKDTVMGVWDAVKEGTSGALSFISNAVDRIKSLMDSIKGALSSVGNAVVSAGQNLGKTLGFASGGIVPGPLGAAQLAVVHGGEQFIPAASMRTGQGGMGGGSGVNITITGNTISSDLDMRDLAMRVGDAVMQNLRSNIKF